ncbi:MAG TPA: energy transducer TonB [Opitutaceae bacterium]
MNTNYLLPAAAALMAHSALLFGVVSAPAIVPPDKDDERVPDTVLIPIPLIEELIVEPAVGEEYERPAEDVSFTPASAPGPVITAFDFSDRPLITVENFGTGPLAPAIAGGDGPGGLAGGPRVFRTSDLDHAPRVRASSAPGYPFEARKAGLTGEVLVEFLVNELGEVESPRAVRSSDPRFVEAAIKAAARWRFEPGRKDGRPVRFRMAVPFVFTLDR